MGSPTNEMECVHCLVTKPLSDFAKVYRRDRDNAICLICAAFNAKVDFKDAGENNIMVKDDTDDDNEDNSSENGSDPTMSIDDDETTTICVSSF
jgi:hypothetical protein